MKTQLKRNLESVTEYLESLSNSDLVSIWNEFAREQRPDDEIYFNDEEFFNVFFDGRIMDAIRAISYGEYDYSHEYVIFNGYANLETFNDPTGNIDINELAEDILENEQNYYDIELEDEDEDDDTDEDETEDDE